NFIAPQVHRWEFMKRLASCVALHDTLFLQDSRNRQSVDGLIRGLSKLDGNHFRAHDVGRIPAEHESQHLLEGLLLSRCGLFVKVDDAMSFAGVLIDQVTDRNRLKPAHVYLAVMTALDVGKVCGVA